MKRANTATVRLRRVLSQASSLVYQIINLEMSIKRVMKDYREQDNRYWLLVAILASASVIAFGVLRAIAAHYNL